MLPTEGYIGAYVLRDQILNGIKWLPPYIYGQCLWHWKGGLFSTVAVASQEKALVTGAWILTFAEKLFLYISVDIGIQNTRIVYIS